MGCFVVSIQCLSLVDNACHTTLMGRGGGERGDGCTSIMLEVSWIMKEEKGKENDKIKHTAGNGHCK